MQQAEAQLKAAALLPGFSTSVLGVRQQGALGDQRGCMHACETAIGRSDSRAVKCTCMLCGAALRACLQPGLSSGALVDQEAQARRSSLCLVRVA